MTNGNGGNGREFLMSGSGGIPGGAPGGSGFSGVSAPPPEPESPGLSLRDYAAVLWRRKWIILLVVVVATASAYFFSARQTPVYQASADLIYEMQLDVANPLTGQSYTDTNERSLELRSVGNVLASPEMIKRVASLLEKEGAAATGFTISSAPVTDAASANQAGESSNVVRITASSEVPELAAAAADANAKAFTEWRKETVRSQIDRAVGVIKGKLATYKGAAKQSTDYLVLQQRFQDLEILQATATGNFRLLVPAAVPEAPVEPRPLRSAILGLGVGLFAGIGIAFLLEQFDTRIRRPDEIAAILRQPILGRIPRISRKLIGESSLVALKHPDGHVAEAFRMVRTNLDFMAVDGDVRSIVITSCMKGEGKSVTVANLAISMAQAGKKVVVVDADMRRPRQAKLFGLPNDIGLSTVASGQTRLNDALRVVQVVAPQNGAEGADLTSWTQGEEASSRLYVLTSGPIPPNPGEIVSSKRFDSLLQTLVGEADVAIVDSPAMLAVGDTSAIAAKVDGLVFLADLEVIKRPQLSAAADQLLRLPTRMLGIVVRMSGKGGGRYYYSPYYYYRYSDTDDGQKVKTKRPREAREGQTTA